MNVDRSKWMFHPIVVFIFSIIALGLSLFLYIYWYMEVSIGLQSAVKKFDLDASQFMRSDTWVVILVLSILVAIILLGIFLIFVYSRKISQLYRLQHNFIANFTHELKTPVTSLKLYIETFLKHDIPREQMEKYFTFMIQDVERLSDNINRILDLSRIESKSFGGEFEKKDVESVLDGIVKNCRYLYPGCEIVFRKDCDEKIVLKMNPVLFDILVSNLISNGVKYNDSDRPKIEVSLQKTRTRVIVTFSDNGIGIEKKELKKIFRKFYQIGQANDMTAKGSGIGLYIAQNIARLHKGKISAHSSGKGKGTSFQCTLPIRNS